MDLVEAFVKGRKGKAKIENRRETDIYFIGFLISFISLGKSLKFIVPWSNHSLNYFEEYNSKPLLKTNCEQKRLTNSQ